MTVHTGDRKLTLKIWSPEEVGQRSNIEPYNQMSYSLYGGFSIRLCQEAGEHHLIPSPCPPPLAQRVPRCDLRWSPVVLQDVFIGSVVFDTGITLPWGQALR